MADSLFLYLNNRCTAFFFIVASNKQKATRVGEGKLVCLSRVEFDSTRPKRVKKMRRGGKRSYNR